MNSLFLKKQNFVTDTGRRNMLSAEIFLYILVYNKLNKAEVLQGFLISLF